MSAALVLHHFAFDPASRLVRLALGEKRLPFSEVSVRWYEADAGFEQLNPSGRLPVLVVEDQDQGDRLVLCETWAILGFLEEEAPEPPLTPDGQAERAEMRRLLQWFERKFEAEVDALLLHEKMEKRLLGLGSPDMTVMRDGRQALRRHLGYAETLLRDREWLAGRRLSLADFAAAARLSVLDYFAEVAWAEHPALKDWYMKLKSRPCFRPLLADRLPGMPPASHYDDLDF
jgi:glutathione S-transferase